MLISPSTLVIVVSIASVYAYDFSWMPEWKPAGVPAWTAHFASQSSSYSNDITSCHAPGLTNVWGASFDDGPGPDTGVVLNYFASKKMLATFWVIGFNVKDFPDTLAATYAAGHNIGVHTWSHADLTSLSNDQVVSQLVYGARAIYEVTGTVPKYFRPPYGAVNDNVRTIAAGLGLHSVTWSQDSSDWSYIGKAGMENVPTTFQSWMSQGLDAKISLEHDYDSATAKVVPQSMDILIGAGKRIVPLSECIGDNVYNNTILTSFFQRGGLFEQYAGGKSPASPLQSQQPSNSSLFQPTQSVSCQSDFTFGTDSWGKAGCISGKTCPVGGAWSVLNKKCDCLPSTPVWDTAALTCKVASTSINKDVVVEKPASLSLLAIVLISCGAAVGVLAFIAIVCILARRSRKNKKRIREELRSSDADERSGFLAATP
ncbi:UNVERIFIED_CONTAM: chitin deacetylase [Siphonaria sp. JEL0065]|nr:chitin deacetylase [Siphonaria sp. JEL0065]